METTELREYMRPLLKWWWLLAASTLLAGISSAVYTSRQPPVFRSTTTLMVGTALQDPNPNSGEFNLASQLAAVYADMANRSAIRDATRVSLGLDWLPNYSARVIPNTQIIEISVFGSSATATQMVADELAAQLILATPGERADHDRQTFIEQQLTQLEASIVETNDEIERIEQELTQMFSARQIADAKAQIAALESKVATLQTNYAALLANSRQEATNTISILDPASYPQNPVNDDLATNVMVSALVGFALAAAGAYVMEYLDDTLRDEENAVRELNLPALGSIPKVSGKGADERGLMMAGDQHTPVTDAYASLRLNVQVATLANPLKLLLISSPAAGEGKSTVAANLSIELARTGRKVILVDADLHKPTQQRLFNLDNRTGLTTHLLDPHTHLSHLTHQTKVQGLSVLTSGPLLPNPIPLLARESMSDLLVSLQEMADIVVLDTAPMTASATASILAQYADGIALVVSAGRTKRGLAKRAVKGLQQIQAPLLGLILYDTPLKQSIYRASYGHRVGLEDMPSFTNFSNPFHSRKRQGRASVWLNQSNGDLPREPKAESEEE